MLALSINAQTAAPPVVATFQSNSTENPAMFPADAAGAVGPNHVVGVTNNGIVVQSRTGAVLQSKSLFDLWFDPTLNTAAEYFDAHVLYDAAADRWVMAAEWDVSFQTFGMAIAASKTGDPTGEWHRFIVNFNVPGRFIDFTRLGMTSDRIVVTYNDNAGSVIATMLKSDLYDGTGTYQSTQLPFRDLHPVTFLDNSSSDVLLLLDNPDSGALNVYRFDGSTITQTARFTTAPWEALPAAPFVPQLDSTKLMDAGDWSVQSALGRNGSIWAVHTIVRNGHSAIRWWKVSVTSGAQDTGTIEDPSGNTFYGFPSIAVNRLGGAAIGYCYYSAAIHPSFGFSYRDPSGTMSASGSISSGTSVPVHQRWGDFTTAVVDPANDLDFWITGPSATSQIWSTWWGQVRSTIAPARVRAVRH